MLEKMLCVCVARLKNSETKEPAYALKTRVGRHFRHLLKKVDEESILFNIQSGLGVTPLKAHALFAECLFLASN